MHHLVAFVIRHGYAVMFFWVLAEQAALPLPSPPLLLACGALVRSGRLNLLLVVFWGIAGCLIGDTIWFHLGRSRGPKVLRFVCKLALEPDSCVRRTENTFLKYGMRSLLVAKFVPGLNAVAAPLAGSAGVNLARFLLFDCVGAFLWIGSYVITGYLFSDQLERVADLAVRMGSRGVLLVAGLLAAWIAWKFFQRQRLIKDLAVARITPEELQKKLEAGEDVTIVDVRIKLEAEKDSPIPGVLRISSEELEARHQE